MTATAVTAAPAAEAGAYRRELEWNEPPSDAERRYLGWMVIRAAEAPAPRWRALARIGDVDLYLAPPGTERDAPAVSVEPVVAGKRGRRGGGDYVGVDGQVRGPEWHSGGAAAAVAAAAAVLPEDPVADFSTLPSGLARSSGAIRVAVIDVSFDNAAVLADLGSGGAAVDGPFVVGLPGDDGAARARAGGGRGTEAPLSGAAGHGTAMAGILLSEVSGVRVGLFRIPSVGGAARPYLAATDLGVAIAAAVEGWCADVVLIAMSDGAWGTPRHLADVLRAAARTGRGGRGAAIFCSVGDPSRNHERRYDSAALGADDLASQPWVAAVAACDDRGRWYRVYPGYDEGGGAGDDDDDGDGGDGGNGGGDGGGGVGTGATYNRFGPAVALSAPGEPRRYGDRIAADDSSQASALAAAAAARTLAENPACTALELRALLALTADVPPIVDGGRGLVAGAFDGRDRLGHSLKIGHGVVNARAACLAAADPIGLALLATREIPDPITGLANPALRIGETWRAVVRCVAARDGAEGELARGYLAVAGGISQLFLGSLAVQEALCWLARHLRALVAAPHPLAAASSASWAAQDHGALVERLRYAANAIAESCRPDQQALIAWSHHLGTPAVAATLIARLATSRVLQT